MRGVATAVQLALLLAATALVQAVGVERAWAQSEWFEPPPLPERPVSEIRIEGTRRVEPNAVRNVLGTRVGRPLDRDQVRRDIMAIRSLATGGTPFFDDVQVLVEEGAEGSIVVYRLQEKPVIAELRYEFSQGDELDDDIEEVVDLNEGDIFDLSRVRRNVRKIEELYREKGYYLAEVDFRWAQLEDGDVLLVFDIREFAEVEVRRVTFIGNEALSDEELRSIMATRPGELLGFLTDAGVFNETNFANDRRRLRAYYYEFGYVDVEVGEPQVELSRDLTEIFITIPIVEGEQYAIAGRSIRGDLLEPAEALMDRFVRVEEGQTFASSAVRQDIERLTTFYKDAGYANVNVNLGTHRDPESRTIDVVYDIQQGELVHIGRINLIGNETTRDEVIRREMRIHESDLYNGTAIRLSRARILRLGFFDSVEIREVTTADERVMNLEVEVSERATGQFQVGAGFSSVESFIATATISQNNLLGRGQTLTLNMSLSALRTIFTLGFSEPYFFGTRWQFGFEIFNRELLFTDFTRKSLGFSVTIGHPITDDILVSGTYQFEDVDVEPGGRSGRRDRRLNNLFQGGRTSSLQASILWDTRNNRLFPSQGFLHSASVEWANEILQSENEFIRFRLLSRWYYEIISGVVLKFNASLAWIATTDPERPVPIFERFFLGGPNSVRGFERATLSPTQPVAADPNDPESYLVGFPVGGDKSLVFNLEVEFPILTAIGIRGVVFADAGNAFSEDQSFSVDMDIFHPDRDSYDDVLRTAVGFGFRWISPIGPLRFEWGFPLNPLDDEDTSVFEFSIGNFL